MVAKASPGVAGVEHGFDVGGGRSSGFIENGATRGDRPNKRLRRHHRDAMSMATCLPGPGTDDSDGGDLSGGDRSSAAEARDRARGREKMTTGSPRGTRKTR